MSKHRLVVDEEYDFLAFGISCHLKDFRVAWHLNKLFKFDLRRDSIEVKDKEMDFHQYSTFVHRDPDNHLKYLLLNNYSEDIALLKNQKQFNLFLLIEGYIEIFDATSFEDHLHAIEAFQFVAQINPGLLKKYQYMLFED